MISAKGRNGTISFDGAMVTISRGGFFGRASVGKGEKRIPLRSITAVQWKPPGPLVNGFIAFTLAGGNEARSRFGRQTPDASRDENAVVVTKGQAKAMLAVRDAIEQALAGV